jgi:hypothetical protein
MHMKKICFLVMVIVFTFFYSQALAATISGQVTYSGSQTGQLYLGYFATSGGSCTAATLSSATVVGPFGSSFPYNYNLTVSDGTYCIGAFLDVAGNGFPPDLNDPKGIHADSVTVQPDATDISIQLYDPGNLNGAWDVGVNVTINIPGLPTENCTYSGSAEINHFDSVLYGEVNITRSSGSTYCPTPLNPIISCDTSAYPTLNCELAGVPDGPYDSGGTITSNGFSANGTFNGDYEGATFNVSWEANKRKTIQVSVPTMTEWGMIIMTVLLGIGSIYYLRRRVAA